MRVLLLGAPGSGKGTQANVISQHYNIQKFSTGDMLRIEVKKQTRLGLHATEYMKKGELVPDELVINMLKVHLFGQSGYLLDGFPRNVLQAKAMEAENLLLDVVINLSVDFDLLVERVVGRRVHIPSGRVYHVKYSPPKIKGIDDISGESLVHREDDQEETIMNRLMVYQKHTSALIGYYQEKASNNPNFSFIEIDGNQMIHQVELDIFKALEKIS